jgi:hypothetical protein
LPSATVYLLFRAVMNKPATSGPALIKGFLGGIFAIAKMGLR